MIAVVRPGSKMLMCATSRPRYPLVRKSIRMKRDGEILLPSWRRPFPHQWVKVGAFFSRNNVEISLMVMQIDQRGAVSVTLPDSGGNQGRMEEVPGIRSVLETARLADERGGCCSRAISR